MGEWPVTDSAGNTYQAYRDHFKWEIGLVARDWRYNVRIPNIDITQLTGVSAANLINLIVRGLYKLPTAPSAATAIQSSLPLREVAPPRACALVVGHESKGVSEAVRACAQHVVRIPMAPGVTIPCISPATWAIGDGMSTVSSGVSAWIARLSPAL